MDESGSGPRIFRVTKKMIISAFVGGLERFQSYKLFDSRLLLRLSRGSGVFSFKKALHKTFFKTNKYAACQCRRLPRNADRRHWAIMAYLIFALNRNELTFVRHVNGPLAQETG